jgi:HK97 family phage portal protein
MGWLQNILFGSRDTSADMRSLEDPSVPLSAASLSDLGQSASYDAGVAVTVKTALGYAPLYQAVNMIGGDVAKMPAGVFQRTATGRTLLGKHPANVRIRKYGLANSETNTYKFWKRFMTSCLLHQNGYAYIDKSSTGKVLGLYNLLPDRTTPVRFKGQVWYVTEVGGKIETIPADNILHVEGLSIDGMGGESIVKLFREDIGVALARRRFTARFFKQGMTAGGILALPPNAKPEAVRKIRAAIAGKFSGTDEAFKTIVLRDGFRWYSTQVDPEKAQLIEMDEQQARNVARMYNLDPSRLGVSGSSSYNADEMARRNYHDGALSHWLIATAAEMNHKLLTQEERDREIYIDYNINALLWADSIARSQIANTGIINGRFSPNETRAWENLDDYAGGDVYYQPLNVVPVGTQADNSNSDLMRALLEDTFKRVINRLCIKAERCKGGLVEHLASERSVVIDILRPTLAVALSQRGLNPNDASTKAGEWWETWLRSSPVDAIALRVSAETAATNFISDLCGAEEVAC